MEGVWEIEWNGRGKGDGVGMEGVREMEWEWKG
jgi:hypothetical protein